MFQPKSRKGVVKTGLVAASVMLFLRDPIMAPVGDLLSSRFGVNVADMSIYMGLIALYYIGAGMVLGAQVKNASSVAFSAAFWTIGLAVFWLVYTYSLGPILQGTEAMAFPAPEVWALNFGVEAMAFLAVVGAFLARIKSA